MKKLNAIFMGTPDFSMPTLEALYNHPQINLKAVVSMPDRPAGRGNALKSPPVVELAKHLKIPIVQTENINKESDILDKWEKEGIDFILVLAFAQFLGKKILNLPKHGCFNIHTSLLPKYRGAAPIQYALLNGDTSTGVSIQKMVKEMDAGDLVHSREVAIHQFETGGSLYTKLKFQAGIETFEFVQGLIDENISFETQDYDKVTFAPTLKKEDGKLDFNELSAQSVFNKVKALIPWPGTYCFLNKKRLKVLGSQLVEKKLCPGELYTKEGSLLVGCSEGSIRLNPVQFEGKKACSDTELLNGLKNSGKEINLT